MSDLPTARAEIAALCDDPIGRAGVVWHVSCVAAEDLADYSQSELSALLRDGHRPYAEYSAEELANEVFDAVDSEFGSPTDVATEVAAIMAQVRQSVRGQHDLAAHIAARAAARALALC